MSGDGNAVGLRSVGKRAGSFRAIYTPKQSHGVYKIIRQMRSSGALYGVIKKIDIKMDIMAEQNRIADKSAQRRHDLADSRSICHHVVCDPIKKRYENAERTRGFYKSFVCRYFVAVSVTNGRYFDDLITSRIKAGRFNINSNKLIGNHCSAVSFKLALFLFAHGATSYFPLRRFCREL